MQGDAAGNPGAREARQTVIDLHLHSHYSDGTMSPAELVRVAAVRNLAAIAITDHDTAAATAEAIAAGRVAGVEVVSGVELSVFDDSSFFHLLGYGFNADDSNLSAGLRRLQESRHDRNRAILGKLAECGITLTEAELAALSGQGQTGRPHIARLLVQKKIVPTMQAAFDRYLKKGACAYVERFIYSAEAAISLIHGAGGLAVLAHPVQLDPSLSLLPRLLEKLVRVGLDGLEVYYPTQRKQVRRNLSVLAGKYNLLETGGSDYHGDIRLGTSMAGGSNLRVPAEVLERLHQRKKQADAERAAAVTVSTAGNVL